MLGLTSFASKAAFCKAMRSASKRPRLAPMVRLLQQSSGPLVLAWALLHNKLNNLGAFMEKAAHDDPALNLLRRAAHKAGGYTVAVAELEYAHFGCFEQRVWRYDPKQLEDDKYQPMSPGPRAIRAVARRVRTPEGRLVFLGRDAETEMVLNEENVMNSGEFWKQAKLRSTAKDVQIHDRTREVGFSTTIVDVHYGS